MTKILADTSIVFSRQTNAYETFFLRLHASNFKLWGKELCHLLWSCPA